MMKRKSNGQFAKGMTYEMSASHKRKIGRANTGDRHGLWKGGKVGYAALHEWVERKLGKPQKCSECKRTKAPKGKGIKRSYFEWANVSGLYKRELTDWKRLCIPCHRVMDGARENLGDRAR